MPRRPSIPAALILLAACAQGGGGTGRRHGLDSGIRLMSDGGGGPVDGGRGGPDAGRPDAGRADTGPPVECSVDTACDDGLACDGVESCGATGVCVTAPHPGCDDGVSCTVDACTEPAGDCTHTPDDSLCAAGQTCDATGDCVTPPACLSDAMCDDGLACNGAERCDPAVGCRSGVTVSCDDRITCTADACSEPAGTCSHVGIDADADGHVAMGCAAGDDCDDRNPGVHPGAAEVCDGVDNDCNGVVDDGPGLACRRGTPPMACTTACGTSGTRPCSASCAWGTCLAAAETCGNACDDNGNGLVDEGCGPPPPANDQCSGAVLLSGSGTRTTDTLVGATAQASGCGSGSDVFYRVSLARKSIVYLDTFGTSFDTRVSYRGTSCPGTSSTCIDDSCRLLQAQLAVVVSPGTHYFAVHTYSSFTTPGPLTLRYQIVDAAAGDNTRITASGTYSGVTTGANGVTASCAASASSPEDCFYWLQCASDSRSVTATTCNASTNYDTALHLHGTAEIACNDDDFSCTYSTLRSRLTGTTTGAGVFRLFVDGFSSSSSGTYAVTITL